MPRRTDPVDPLTEVPNHLAEVLETLKILQERLKVETTSGLAGSKGAGVNAAHVRMAMQLSTATSNLSRETRAWTRRVKELAGSATLEERLGAVKSFLKSLPEADLVTFLCELNEDLDAGANEEGIGRDSN